MFITWCTNKSYLHKANEVIGDKGVVDRRGSTGIGGGFAGNRCHRRALRNHRKQRWDTSRDSCSGAIYVGVFDGRAGTLWSTSYTLCLVAKVARTLLCGLVRPFACTADSSRLIKYNIRRQISAANKAFPDTQYII